MIKQQSFGISHYFPTLGWRSLVVGETPKNAPFPNISESEILSLKDTEFAFLFVYDEPKGVKENKK